MAYFSLYSRDSSTSNFGLLSKLGRANSSVGGGEGGLGGDTDSPGVEASLSFMYLALENNLSFCQS